MNDGSSAVHGISLKMYIQKQDGEAIEEDRVVFTWKNFKSKWT